MYNGCRIHVDIMAGENCHQIRLLFPLSFIGQFVHPERGDGIKGVEGEDRNFSSLRVHFIREYENLV